jgi:hypothetical protein
MPMRLDGSTLLSMSCLVAALATAACSNKGDAGSPGNGGNPNTNPDDGPPAGNPDGGCAVPAAAALEDVSHPTTVVGDGTPASCTSAAVVAAVAKGGVITFSCGPDPIVITLEETAKVFNDTGPKIVLDGGGKVTLSGGGAVRILYQDTCDQAQVWTTSHCENQSTPALTVQNMTFVDGNATGQEQEGGGGGAIFVRGGLFKVVSSRFFHGACDPTGHDVGGAAIRVLSMYNNQPVYVVNSTFGGKPGYGGSCSNGGALSSIGVSWVVLNSVLSDNAATGSGVGPAGCGGAIYTDGNTYTETLCGVVMSNNTATDCGGGIVFFSGDGTGSLTIQSSFLSNNTGPTESKGYPGIYYWTSTGQNDTPLVMGSTIQ